MSAVAIRLALRRVAWLAVLAVLCWTAGCNTIEGIGQDVEAGGKAISKAASKSKSK